MYMGVILTIFMGRRGELRIPHVYGGDPNGNYTINRLKRYSPCIWG